MTAALRGKAAIVGVGTTPFAELSAKPENPRSAYDLASDALSLALADSGLGKSDIDGLLCARVPAYAHMADLFGLRHLKFVNSFDGSGRMSGVALEVAVMAVASGLANTVALVYGNNGRSAGARYGGGEGVTPTDSYDAVYGMTSPGAYVGMMYQRYMHEFRVPDGALATLAINNRANAALNPNAVMRSPIDLDTYMSARFIAEPLRLFDYCLINDGGVALIVTTPDRARDLAKPPVHVRATAACSDLSNFYTSPDYFYTACNSVSSRIYADAGIAREDVRCLQVYDNFTPTILFALEGFGYCGRGQAWEWASPERISLHGELPVNTSGGHTSESYMQGWALHAEAVRQVRGECGPRQVPDCDVVQYICPSPIVTSHVLATEP
jgi:acetyl-CoA acetyltransferase